MGRNINNENILCENNTNILNNRDVLLLELEESQKIANNQIKVYRQMINILTGVLTFAIPLFINFSNHKQPISNFVNKNDVLLSIVLSITGGFLLRYLVDIQKQITINGRKVVLLRNKLGLDYGNDHLILPNWRVEGANNPFAIKYFKGWLSFQSLPFWVLLIGINTIWLITLYNNPSCYLIRLYDVNCCFPILYGNITTSLIYIIIFRQFLNDTHETFYLNIVRDLAKLIRIKLVDDFEQIIYNNKLKVRQLNILDSTRKDFISILISIEDKTFENNIGFSCKPLIRAFLSQFKYFRNKFDFINNGGSTITMQLARTLFITDRKNKYKRKLFEILISLWIYNKFSKADILNLYIVSVRFYNNVYGISDAIKVFFNKNENSLLSPEECFVLVERLSNSTKTFKKNRIEYLIKKSNIKLDSNVINKIYSDLINKGIIQNTN